MPVAKNLLSLLRLKPVLKGTPARTSTLFPVNAMNGPYVEEREGGYWVAGTRVSLESVVMAFLDGRTPESIAVECFPTLTLEQVYGALTYYLGHRREIDAYLEEVEVSRTAAREAHHDPALARELAAARQQLRASQP